MPRSVSQRGRALPLLLALCALGILALLLFADPFGWHLLAGGPGAEDGGVHPALLGDEPEAGRETARAPQEATLEGLYGRGDLGALRLRLLWIGTRKPLVGQAVELQGRHGEAVATVPSDPAGRVLFKSVRPARGYRLHIAGKGFSEVVVEGIGVFPRATKDLGDIVLGRDVVLRGRVVDSTGKPVPGTTVSVHTIERSLGTKGLLVFMAEQAAHVPTPLQSVQSDEAGYFAFTALDDGAYTLVAHHGGYASTQTSDVLVAHRRGAGTLTIVLGDGGRVSGTVTDEAGKPVAGAQVVALRDTRGMRTPTLQREVAVTAKDGTYVIDTLSVGQRYRYGVLAAGYAPVYEVAGATAERENERDFVLVQGGTLTGVVSDQATGKPVEGARVAVYVGPLGWGRRRRDPDARAAADVRRTDAEGRFRFDALVPGPVSAAVVQASGYVSGRFSRSPFGGADTSWPDVVSGETTEVTAALQRGGTVTGTVRVKEGGQALQGAEVTLEQTDMRARFASLMTGTPTALSGADGGFTLDGVLPGTYRLLVSAAGYSPAGDPQGVQVTMPESGGSVEQALEVTAAGVVTGVVTDPQGEPIAGVRIGLRRGPGQGARRRGMDFLRRMLASAAPPADLSDAQGRFRLESVGTDGSWIVEGHSDEYVGGESKPFQVRPGEVQEVSLQMVPGGALRGRVVDENGRWVPGARVQVGRLPDDLAGVPRLSAWQARRALGATIYSTDEQGRFLATNLQPGRQLVRVSKDGYVTWFKRDVVIETGATHDNYTVALSRGEVLEGVVLDTDGHPVRRASVSATQGPPPGEAQASVANANGEAGSDASGAQANANVEPAVYARTDAQGHFRIENLERGAWNVFVAFAPGVKSWMREHSPAALRRNVSVPAPPLEFRLERAAPASVPRPSGAGRGGR